ncbi:outer membrane protein assembly factor BamC [Litoribacillus peritrichatus]|uniref:Outer membrane protein assembly factor BamC n=1 Tax=Litoribacillus peritrichatus TaxID=718191 RepID=A0ABP7N8T0_9GAMM
MSVNVRSNGSGRWVKSLSFLSAALVLSSCSLFTDLDEEYKHIEATKPTQGLKGQSPTEFIDLYPVPELKKLGAGELVAEVPRPEPLSLTDDKDGVQLRKLDDQRWIVVAQPPNQVWPLVRQFWDLHRIAVVYEQPNKGVLETRWVKRNDERQSLMSRVKGRVYLGDDLLDKYRVSVEQGIRSGLTEVHVVQRSVGLYDSVSAPVVYEPNEAWPKQSENLALSAAVIDELITYLAKQVVSGQTTSFLAEGIVGESRVSIENTETNVVLQLEARFDRAWASVVNSEDERILKVTDRNRSEGNIFVTYNHRAKEEEPGIFARIFGADLIEESDRELILKVIEIDEYRAQVRVTDKDGNEIDKSEALEVLEFVKDRLY